MASLKYSVRYMLDCQPLWRAILAISALAIIYLATTSHSYPIPPASSDKLNHLLAFIQLTVVTRLAWPGLRQSWIIAGMMAFGLSIEIVQAQLPYREFSLADLAANGAGVAIGLIPCALLFSQSTNKSTS